MKKTLNPISSILIQKQIQVREAQEEGCEWPYGIFHGGEDVEHTVALRKHTTEK